MTQAPGTLPLPDIDQWESRAVLKKTAEAHRYLAELNELPKIYRQELLNNLFNHPYTKIEFDMEDLGVSRITATRYLEELVKADFVSKHKVGRGNYYINQPLCELLIAHS